ncbi:hypothetical protein B0J11DRAFT_606805 [Dendryphion nanum]|uniref:RBR-type E3 ubiquitin transferase n=1 Tax=Dendryphion nanum TaxID=256645 RepID=A0A9P9DR70_9PLEO|nr:hypothetical protein B0J11DRAFT_606805 [Dendryphion nanum]
MSCTLICSGCLESASRENIVLLDCAKTTGKEDHQYCHVCFEAIFQSSFLDISTFPPRCCSPLPLSKYACHLSYETVEKYLEIEASINTPPPLHCSNKPCHQVIPPTNIGANNAYCPVCSTQTCPTCKAAAHNGLCPTDPDVRKLLKLAHDQNWKKCPSCNNMIARTHGCNHMTCRCSYQFCYVCTQDWSEKCGCQLSPPRQPAAPLPETNTPMSEINIPCLSQQDFRLRSTMRSTMQPHQRSRRGEINAWREGVPPETNAAMSEINVPVQPLSGLGMPSTMRSRQPNQRGEMDMEMAMLGHPGQRKQGKGCWGKIKKGISNWAESEMQKSREMRMARKGGPSRDMRARQEVQGDLGLGLGLDSGLGLGLEMDFGL